MSILERFKSPTPIDPDSERRNAETAFRLFIEVSHIFPASVTAQAAGIAYRCQRENLKPMQLFRALVADREKVGRIIRAANSVHAKSNNPYAPKSLRSDGGVIETDFGLADCYIGIPHERLPTALELYKGYRDRGSNPIFLEMAYCHQVNRMIRHPGKYLKAERISITIAAKNLLDSLEV